MNGALTDTLVFTTTGSVGTETELTTGGLLNTVTLKLVETEDGVSSASVAVHVTFVVPIENVEPDGWSHVTDGVSLPSSVAVGGVYVTVAPEELVAGVLMSAGGDPMARSVSATVSLLAGQI